MIEGGNRMGEPQPGREQRTFVGESAGFVESPATLDEALRSAAEKIVDEDLVSGDDTLWFNVVGIEVEIANQHVKTFRVTVTG